MSTPAAALRTASYHGDAAIVRKLLLEGVDPNVADEFHRTALSHAAGEGHAAVVDVLLAGGAWAEPHEDYDVYETPLMAAATHGHLEIVKKLVEAGADPTFHVGVSQRTAESYARLHNHTQIAEYLASLPRR
jgi:ankyrin repeat protein